MIISALVISVLITVAQIQTVHGIIVPKLLLPFHGDYQVNYTINADDGCYRWRSLREEVASIHPVDSTFDSVNMCSRSAVVMVRSTQPARKTTLILATNVKTGTVFQCDVIIDQISVIDIISRTKELYLADPPEELKIRALDQEGNTFSSTAGMVFEWSLAQDDGSTNKEVEKQQPLVSAHNILHIQRFLDTVYVPETYVGQLEDKGKMSDTILISGVQTGAAVVVADLLSTIDCHKAVEPASVRFLVRDKVILNPTNDLYLLQHAVVRYTVERWRQGKPTEIEMPSSQYVLNIRQIYTESGTVINLEQKTSFVTGLNKGHSQVFLIDRHLKHYDDSLMEQATSDVYVVGAAYLKFKIEPYNKWVLEVGKTYVITVHMYTEENKQILTTDNVRLAETLNENYLEVLGSVKNGTWFYIQTLTKGSCDIASILKGVVIVGNKIVKAGVFSFEDESLEVFKNPISATQNIEIFDTITVSPTIVLFPWQPDPVQYKYRFRARGGSGNYTWSVNDTDSSNISYTGMLSIQSGNTVEHGPRTVEIRATDIRNSYHYGEATAILASPAKLHFALSILEAEVGTTLNLYITMFAKLNDKFIPFSDCSKTNNLQWSIHDNSIFEFIGDVREVPDAFSEPAPQSTPCLMRQVRAIKEGHTTVSLSYFHNLMNQTLQASTVIASFNRLKVIDPSHLAVVSLDSTKNLIFQGGPNPWPLLPNNHEKLITADNDKVQLQQKVSAKEHVFISHCVQLGTSFVTLTVQNRPCNTNPYPKQSQFTVEISCTIPASLKLMTEYLPESCPLFQNQNSQTVVLAGDKLDVKLTAFDSFGNEFDNFTSLAPNWKISPHTPSLFPVETRSLFQSNSNQQSKHHIMNDILIPSNLGDSSLHVTIEGYSVRVKRNICSPVDCKIKPPVFASIVLVIVGPVTLAPSSIMLFNRPDHSMSMEISGGSGYFQHEIRAESRSSNSVIKVAKDEYNPERLLSLHPLAVGHAHLLINDLCIPSATSVKGSSARSDITVSDVSSLFLTVNYLLEIGSTAKASIQLDMEQLSLPDKFELNILLTAEPEGIVGIGLTEKEGEKLSYNSVITALKIGNVNVKASTYSRDGTLITSNTVKVMVFPPLKLLPSRITVIQGSEFHLYVDGGPPDDVHIHYDVEDSKIASASSSGVLSALNIGNTSVSARAITKDGEVFNSVSATQIFVVQIKGVWIDIPTYRYKTGTIVPVHVYGSAGPGYDSVSLDSDAAGLIFTWKVNNHAVVNIHSVHSHAGVEVPDTLKFTMLLNGTGPGQSSVSVAVSATQYSLGQLAEPILEAEIQVSVFDPLSIQSSLSKVWNAMNSLYLTPDTAYSISSNRDGLAQKIDYFGLCKFCNLSISSQDSDCITINQDLKTLTTGKHPCQATMLVAAQEQFNAIQTLAIHVKVKLVSYVIAIVKNKFYVKNPYNHLSGFPLGSQLTIEIQQFDNFGSRFDVAKPEIIFNSNRNDILEITPNQVNNLLTINAPRTGVTIFKIWSGKDTTYIFPLNIISTIKGEGTRTLMTVGVKKCFESNLVDANGKPGNWNMNNHRSFVVDSSVGAVLPLSRASGEMEFSLNDVHSKLQISSEAFWVRFDENYLPEFVTNVESKFILPLILSDEKHERCEGLKEEMDEFAKNTFKCAGFLLNTVDQVNIFVVKAAYLPNIDSFACILDLIEQDESTKERISTFDASFTLSLSVHPDASEGGISLQSPVNRRFIPAFKLINDTEIVIIDGKKSHICISATMEVHKSIDMTTDIRYIEFEAPERYVEGIACYSFSYSHSDDMRGSEVKNEIKIFSTLTHQEQYVEVSIQHSTQFIPISKSNVPKCVDPQIPSNMWVEDQYSNTYWGFVLALLIIIFTTLVILITCGFFKWAFSDPGQSMPQDSALSTPGPRRSPPGLAPYSPSNSILFRRSSPRNRGSPSSQSDSASPGRVRLWSTYYEQQQAG